MALSDKPIGSIAEADLLALIGEMEVKTLEFKREVGRKDEERKEFLYDVSSFANAAGGHIVVGMEEGSGPTKNQAEKLVGLPGVNPADEITRLEQMARHGIRPPIPGLHTVPVKLSSGEFALVMRVPKSWNPPHQVTFQNAFRFYGRGTNGKYQIDVDELRSIFSLSAAAAERIRLFRLERIARIVAGEAPVPLEVGGKVVTHLLPLSAFALGVAANLRALADDPRPLVSLIGAGGGPRHNVDGLLFADTFGGPAARYGQVFRSGAIEVVESYSRDAQMLGFLPGMAFERDMLRRLIAAPQIFELLGVSPPVVVMISLLGMKGWRIATEMGRSGPGFDRDPLLVPETVFDSWDGPEFEVREQSLLDTVWQAGGWDRSPYFDQRGNRRS